MTPQGLDLDTPDLQLTRISTLFNLAAWRWERTVQRLELFLWHLHYWKGKITQYSFRWMQVGSIISQVDRFSHSFRIKGIPHYKCRKILQLDCLLKRKAKMPRPVNIFLALCFSGDPRHQKNLEKDFPKTMPRSTQGSIWRARLHKHSKRFCPPQTGISGQPFPKLRGESRGSSDIACPSKQWHRHLLPRVWMDEHILKVGGVDYQETQRVR